jgi:hypothetical protein
MIKPYVFIVILFFIIFCQFNQIYNTWWISFVIVPAYYFDHFINRGQLRVKNTGMSITYNVHWYYGILSVIKDSL